MRHLVCVTLQFRMLGPDAIYYITKNLRISDKIDTNDSQGRPKLQRTASSQKVVRERLSTDPTLQHPIYTRNLFIIPFTFLYGVTNLVDNSIFARVENQFSRHISRIARSCNRYLGSDSRRGGINSFRRASCLIHPNEWINLLCVFFVKEIIN